MHFMGINWFKALKGLIFIEFILETKFTFPVFKGMIKNVFF